MKSTNQLANNLVFELIGRVIIDPQAATINEICKETGYGHQQANRRVKEELEAGKLEKVSKRVGRQLVPAYRLKRK